MGLERAGALAHPLPCIICELLKRVTAGLDEVAHDAPQCRLQLWVDDGGRGGTLELGRAYCHYAPSLASPASTSAIWSVRWRIPLRDIAPRRCIKQPQSVAVTTPAPVASTLANFSSSMALEM